MKCDCNMCHYGMAHHCKGPDRAEKVARYIEDYSRASASFVLALATGSMPSDAAREQFTQRVRDASRRAEKQQAKDATMKPTTEQIADAFLRSENATIAADRAVAAHDRECAASLIFAAIRATCDAISISAQAGLIDPIENVAPTLDVFVRSMHLVNKGDFDAARAVPHAAVEAPAKVEAPESVKFRSRYGEEANDDERYAWAAAFAQAMADENTGAVAASFADECIDALRAEMKARNAQ